MSNYTVAVTLQGRDNLTPVLNKANSELSDLKGGNDSSANALGGLATAAAALGSALTLAEVGRKAIELYNLGTAANNAEATFVQLSGGTDAAAASLQAMRRATSGVVDDMTLMQGANKLLMMNLAGTGEEAARLTEIAVKLGSAMGNDAATSIADFAALLANQSIPRLDNFGISSDAVRRKLEELKASGMDAQEAFSMAVMEEGARSLDKLGASADTTGGAVQRMMTNIGNAIQDFAQRFGTGVNSLAGLIEINLGIHPDQVANSEARFSAYLENLTTVYDRVRNGVFGGASNDFMRQIVLEGLTALASDPTLEMDAKRLGQVIYDSMVSKDIWSAAGYEEAVRGSQLWTETARSGLESLAGLITTLNAEQEQTKANTAAIADRNQRIADQAAAIRAEQQQINLEKAKERQLTFEIAAASDAAFEATRKRASATRELGFANQSIGTNLYNVFEALGKTFDPLAVMGMSAKEIEGIIPRYMTDAMAQAIQAQYDDAAAQLERLKELAKDGLITDADLANSSGMVDNLKMMADEATRAADAFDRIKLSEIFGQKEGGLKGQVTDAVIASMQANGATPEQIQAMRDALDLANGRQTGASQFFERTLTPAIATMKPGDAVAIVDAYTSMLNEAKLKGFTPAKIQELQTRFYNTLFGGGIGGNTLTVKPGDTLAGLSAQTGMSVDELMRITGTTNPRLLQPGTYDYGGGALNTTMLSAFNPFSFLFGGTTAAGANMGTGAGFGAGMFGTMAGGDDIVTLLEDASAASDPLKENTAEIADNVERANAILETLAANVTVIRLKLDVDAGIFKELLTRMGIDVTGTSVRDNGGRVRGFDRRIQPDPG